MIPGMFDEVWLFGVKPAGQPGKKPDYMINTCPTMEFETLRTSCNMPSEINWTNKNLYEIAAPYLNKYGKKEVIDATSQTSTGTSPTPDPKTPDTK